MATLTSSQRISVAVALALAGSIAPAAHALSPSGDAMIGKSQRARTFDAPLAQVHDALFMASGREVRRVDRHNLSVKQGDFATWSASAPIVSLTDGTERGLVLALDRRELTLVRFADENDPVEVWSYPIDAAAPGQDSGRLVVRDGNRAFVADASLPGIRVVSIEPDQAPRTLAIYPSPDGVIRDLSLWGRRLTLTTDSGRVVVDVSAGDEPELTRVSR